MGAAKPPRKYVPLDATYYKDIAIRKAGPMAELLYIRSLAFVKCSGTVGFVSRWDLEEIGLGLRGVQKLSNTLVEVGLWEVVDEGWVIRSWGIWNAADAAMSAGGTAGNHARWHVKLNKVDPNCKLCSDSGGESGGDRGAIGGDIAPRIQTKRNEQKNPPNPPAGGDAETTDDRPALTVVPPPAEKPSRRKPSTPLPANFGITDDMRAWLTEKRVNLDDARRQTERFKSWALSKDQRYADWVQAWRNWIDKSIERREVRVGGSTPIREPQHEWEIRR